MSWQPSTGGNAGLPRLSLRFLRGLVVVAGLVWVLALVWVIPELGERAEKTRTLGWGAEMATGSLPVVNRVTPKGPADGVLQVGDKVVEVAGRGGFGGQYVPAGAIVDLMPGKRYEMVVDRDAERRRVELEVVARPAYEWPMILSFLFCSATFAGISWWMGWQKAEVLTARLGWVASQLTAFIYLGLAMSVPVGWPWSRVHAAVSLPEGWQLWTAFWFVLEFPAGGAAGRGWQRVRWGLGGLCAVSWFLFVSMKVPTLGQVEWFAYFPAWWLTAGTLVQRGYHGILAVAVLTALVANYRRAEDRDSRRRIELVAGAIAFALVTIGISSVTDWDKECDCSSKAWVNLSALPVPLCFAYAVLRHRVLDLKLVVRRSLQYVLARQLLHAVTLLLLTGLVVRVATNPGAPVGSFSNVAGLLLLVAAVVALEFRDRIQKWLERWYSREALEREGRLRRLIAEVGSMESWDEVEEQVPGRLEAILDVEGVWFDGAETLRLGVKRSGEEFTGAERDLLELLAAQLRLLRERLRYAEEKAGAIASERQRIAREVHDTAGQGFAGISLYLEAAKKTFQRGASEEATKFLDEAGMLARKSLQETRASIAGWRETGDLDLEARLRELSRRSEAGGPFVSVRIGEGAPERASADARWHLARIAEEAVTNAAKYAGAERIQIELEHREDRVELRVKDNGVGFDPAKTGGRGFGLTGMRERTAQLGGTLTIHSTPGQGTEIRAEVPA